MMGALDARPGSGAGDGGVFGAGAGSRWRLPEPTETASARRRAVVALVRSDVLELQFEKLVFEVNQVMIFGAVLLAARLRLPCS
jgi:hypothetical protein